MAKAVATKQNVNLCECPISGAIAVSENGKYRTFVQSLQYLYIGNIWNFCMESMYIIN